MLKHHLQSHPVSPCFPDALIECHSHVLHRKCTPRYESRFPYDPKHTVNNHLEEQDKTMHPHGSGTLFSEKGVTSKFNLQYKLPFQSPTWICVLYKPPYRIHKLQTLMASGSDCIINDMWLNLSRLLLNPIHMPEIKTSGNC